MALKAFPQQYFERYFHYWAKCLAPQGEYFKGDPPPLNKL